MYPEFLEAVIAYMRALNAASKTIDETDGMAPYVAHVPVVLEDMLCGFLVDEVGGSYQYQEATKDEKTWWDSRP